jgi:hypothetical protein
VFVVAKDRWGRVRHVHYLPNGVRLRAGAVHHNPDVVLTDEKNFTNPLLIHRDGDKVYVHLPNQVITVERGGTLNLTSVVLEFVPVLENLPSIEEIWKMESMLFDPSLPERVRKFLRLYLAYASLKLSENAPEVYMESAVLLSSRMSGIPVEKLVSERKRVEKSLEAQMREELSKMRPEEILQVFKMLVS